MRCACIDIGSNTTRLLVARRGDAPGALDELCSEREFTRLGADRGADGALAPDRIALVADAVARQVALVGGFEVDVLRVVATAAVRDAPNGDDLVAAVRDHAGVEVEVLTGEQEAALAFRGAVQTRADMPEDDWVGVVDVGGGSTEIVCGTRAGGVAWSRSFPIGSGMLTDRHVVSPCPRVDELAAIRAEALRHLRGALPDAPRPQYALAAGGSATSLHRFTAGDLGAAALARALAALCDGTAEEVAVQRDLSPERVRMLPAGIVVLDVVRRALNCDLRTGTGGLREGVLLAALEPPVSG